MKESGLDIIHINNLLDNSMRCEFLMRTRICCGVAHAEINDLLLNEFGQLFTLPNNETFVQVNGRITCQNVFTLISQQAIFSHAMLEAFALFSRHLQFSSLRRVQGVVTCGEKSP